MALSHSNNAGLHVRYEKGGLILDALPIPWNADAVIVEAIVRLPALVSRSKEEFTLQFSTGAPTAWAEVLAQKEKRAPVRVFFRIPVPAQSCSAQVFWREHSLGKIELPIIEAATYVQGVVIEMPTVQVTLGKHTVACQSFLSAQARQVFASALVRAPGPLASALDLDLRVEVQHENGTPVGAAIVSLTSEQRRSRQALATVLLPKPRTVGKYQISWHVASRRLQTQKLWIVSRKTFLRSLRVSATRFLIKRDNGAIDNVRTLPTRDYRPLLEDIAFLSPVFFVCSKEPGMAGIAPFTLRAQLGDVLTTLAIPDDVIVTDGPTPIVLGSVPASALASVKHFTLTTGDTVLGNLPLLPAPKAEFNAEGGFAPLDDYLWSAAADEQLNERLGKLLDDG